jgi:hypothetical protein
LDPRSGREYENADLSLSWEAAYESAPPALREAMDIYREAKRSGRTISQLCKERGRDPVTVRNNMAALKRKLIKHRERYPSDRTGPMT